MSTFSELHGIEHEPRPAFADALDEYLDAMADLESAKESHPEGWPEKHRLLIERVTEARDALNRFFKP